MDKSLVGSLEQVLHDLAVINDIAALWWAAQGYTVIETPQGKAVIGKNAATGEDNPDALTKTWDDPVELESGQWAVLSPVSDHRFANWRDYIPEGVSLLCQEKNIVIPVLAGTSEESGAL